MWKPVPLTLRRLFFVQLFGAFVLGASIWWPKSDVLPCCDLYVGWYRGLGYTGQPGVLGKHYYKVELPPTEPSHGTTIVYLNGTDGYDQFRGYYSNGSIREEGICYVSYDDVGFPMPDIHRVWDATYYKPNGNMGSRVLKGSGHQMYWDIEGRQLWDLKFEDGRRTSS